MANLGALRWLTRWFGLHFLLLEPLFFGIATPKAIIETLPGFQGNLPFKLETGYVGVGNNEDIQLFYYFIESERNPVKDPLLLWLTGGPGCSGISSLLYEMGPLNFDYAAFNGSFPTFLLNPYSYTQVANVIFVDAPVGTGFSYSTSEEGWYTSDTKAAQALYDFLRKWMLDHPRFRANQLYLTGVSYSGMMVPMVVLKMTEALERGDKLFKNLQGYMIGNPITAADLERDSRVEYAHRTSLISDELYKAIKLGCNGSYIDVSEDNVDCTDNLLLFIGCTLQVNTPMILEPRCTLTKPTGNKMKWDTSFIEDISADTVIQLPQRKELWCRYQNYALSYLWANDARVQEALNVRKGTVSDWKRCNKTLAYDYDVQSAVEYHRNLSTRAYRAMIYSGDHDMLAPYIATHKWIESLNLTNIDFWKPWFVDGQVAGFTERYLSDYEYRLTFTTVLGAGHTASEYKPKQCLELVDRWLSYYII